MQDKELVFDTGLTDEELHERWSKLDWDALFDQGMQELKWCIENIEKPRLAKLKAEKEKQGEPIVSANDIGYSSFQDPRLQPPEYDEPNEVEEEATIEFSFDEIITVDSDGSWEYEDQTYAFAANPDSYDKEWYTEEYNVPFRDATDVVENFDEILERNIPMQAGTYRIQGDAELHYKISDIAVYVDNYGPDDYDETVDADHIDVDFERSKSYIKNFQIDRVD